MGKEIIEIQGKLYQVKRKFLESRINLNVEDAVSTLKQYYHCDVMFRAQGFLWLCNKIKDVEYEEI